MTGTRAELEELHRTALATDLVTAGGFWNMSRNTSYEAARAGTFPVPVHKISERTYRVVVADIVAALAPDISAAGPLSGPTGAATADHNEETALDDQHPDGTALRLA